MKLGLIYILVLGIPPATIILRKYLLDKAREMKKNEIKQKKEYEQHIIKQVNYEQIKAYDKEIKPYYENGRAKFNYLIKNRMINRNEIILLKQMIDRAIGSYISYYKKYKFDNDVNEIYVKMKNKFIDKHDWIEIINYLTQIAKERYDEHTYRFNKTSKRKPGRQSG
jgi:hypothetical protein